MPDVTGDRTVQVTSNLDQARSFREQITAAAEGFCPRCRGRMRPLTVEEAVIAATWGRPPRAHCPSCVGDVSWDDDGWSVGFRDGQPMMPGPFSEGQRA